MTAKEPSNLPDRQVAAIRATIAECDRLTLETRKNMRATAALQERNAKALKKVLDPRRGKRTA